MRPGAVPAGIVIFACTVAAQTPVPSQASILISGGKTSLTAGEQVAFRATVHAADGSLRTGVRILWTSENAMVATVSNGLVTARAIGQTLIRAAVDGEPALSTAVRVQSLPRRVDITPSNARVTVGEPVQFTARAIDVNNSPIVGVTFQWSVQTDGLRGLRGVTISNTGLLTTDGSGLVHVSARLSLPFQASGAQTVQATVPVQIDPARHYSVRAVWRSSQRESNPVFRMPGLLDDALRGNEQGQLALHAAVGDTTRALMMVDGNDNLKLIAAAGDPAPNRDEGRRTFVGFGQMSLNQRGDLIAQAETLGPLQLLQAGTREARAIVVSGSAEAYNPATGRVEPVYVWGPQISRHSLTDYGEAVVLLSVAPLLSPVSHMSLFRLGSFGGLQELLSTQVNLPDMPAPFGIVRWQVGMTNDQRVFFIANNGQRRVLYELAKYSTGEQPSVERILGTGDTLDGARVTALDLSASPATFFIGSAGELIVGVNLEGRGSFLLRWSGGDWRRAPEMRQITCPCGVYSSNAAGTLIRTGGAASGGPGLLMWKRDGSSEPVLLLNAALPNGERVTGIQGATHDAQGRVRALVATDANPSTLLAIDGGNAEVRLRSGDALPIEPRSSVLPPLRGTAGAGMPWALTSAGSIVQINEEGPQLRLGVASPLAGDPTQRFGGLTEEHAAVELHGSLEMVSQAGVLRVRPDGEQEVLLRTPITPDVSNINQMGIPSASGHRVWLGPSRAGDMRMLLTSPDMPVEDIARFGVDAQTRLRFDEIEVTAVFRRPWVTEDRRVVAEFATARHGAVVGLWANGVWRAIGAPQRTRLDGTGPLAIRVENVAVSGNRIFAQMIVAADTMVLAEWTGDVWRTLISELDKLPNGRYPAWVGILAVNGRGDIVLGTGEGIVAVRLNNGTFRYVFQRGDGLAGDFGVLVTSALLRDDGTLYISGAAGDGEMIVYKATPLF